MFVCVDGKSQGFLGGVRFFAKHSFGVPLDNILSVVEMNNRKH